MDSEVIKERLIPFSMFKSDEPNLKSDVNKSKVIPFGIRRSDKYISDSGINSEKLIPFGIFKLDDSSLDLGGIKKVDVSNVIIPKKLKKRDYNEPERLNLFKISLSLGIFIFTYFLLTYFVIPIEFLPVIVTIELICLQVYVFKILNIKNKDLSTLPSLALSYMPLFFWILSVVLMYHSMFGLTSTISNGTLIISIFIYKKVSFIKKKMPKPPRLKKRKIKIKIMNNNIFMKKRYATLCFFLHLNYDLKWFKLIVPKLKKFMR